MVVILITGFRQNIQPGNEKQIIGNYGDMAKELYDRGVVSESAYFSLLEDIGIDLSNLDKKEDYE